VVWCPRSGARRLHLPNWIGFSSGIITLFFLLYFILPHAGFPSPGQKINRVGSVRYFRSPSMYDITSWQISLNLYAIWNQKKKKLVTISDLKNFNRQYYTFRNSRMLLRQNCNGLYSVPVNSMLIRSMLIHLGFWEKKKKIMFSHRPLMSNNTKGSQFHSNWIATRSSRPKQCPSHTFASETTKIMKPYIEGGNGRLQVFCHPIRRQHGRSNTPTYFFDKRV
jgi:hypothetical protein